MSLVVELGEHLLQRIVVTRSKEGERRGESAGADARHQVEFRTIAACGPAGKHAGAEGAICAAAGNSQEAHDRPAVLPRQLCDGRRGPAPTSPWPWRRHWEEARRPRSGCSLRPCPPLSRRSPTPMERDCAEAMRRRQDLTPPRRTRKDDVAPARAPRSLIVWARKNSRLVYQERGRFAARSSKGKKRSTAGCQSLHGLASTFCQVESGAKVSILRAILSVRQPRSF